MVPAHMDRREVVRRGMSVGAIAVAGCLDSLTVGYGSDAETTSTNNRNESTNTTEDTTVYDAGDDTMIDELDFELKDSEPIERISIIDVDRPDASEASELYVVILENVGEEPQEFSLRIDRDEETVLEGTEELSANTVLEIAVDDPGVYETIVETESSQINSAMTVEDDCNSRTIISLSDGGGSSTRTITDC